MYAINEVRSDIQLYISNNPDFKLYICDKELKDHGKEVTLWSN